MNHSLRAYSLHETLRFVGSIVHLVHFLSSGHERVLDAILLQNIFSDESKDCIKEISAFSSLFLNETTKLALELAQSLYSP